MNGESFYYQQVVLKKAVFGITFEELRSGFISWKDYYEHLINLGVENGGIEVHRRVNIQTVDDVVDDERGLQVSQDELIVMFKAANTDQKSIFKQLVREMRTNSAAFVSGAAGTGKDQ
ncbi:hypothetical protein G6F43_014189 [Rhizopus delemar]|nr:hypothetical protein G6F43_014189 [Rhizopus delemar]